MFYALNKDGIRMDAYEADKNEQYRCPVCKNRVILKKGSVKADHFAHEANVCEDNWNYDMSEWHKRMQNYFPKESQEVIVSHGGRKHRADVLIGDIVIEFQYSSITAAEFDERNDFFKSAGYRLAWVFNLSQISEENLYMSDEKENMMIWKHPMQVFSNIDDLREKNKKFSLWFSFQGDNEFETIGEETIDRVVWAIKDEDGSYSFSRFILSPYYILMNDSDNIDPRRFFYSKEYRLKENEQYLKIKINKLKSESGYNVKYRGKKGMPKQSYICPQKNEKFGIDIWGEKGCFYCRYCYMVAQKENESGKIYASYCCYPNQIRELDECHPGYECPQVEIIEI